MEIEAPQREFSEVRIQVPWGFISGRWYGSVNLKPILALHGWLDNLGTFDRLIPFLPNHVSVLSIDLPGHGLSSKLPKGSIYHHSNYIAVILLVMQKYKWEKISLMGHSMGAILTFFFALFYPDRVDMIISIDIIKPRYHEPNTEIAIIYRNIERALIENQRLAETTEPPTYFYDELEQLLHTGTGCSVDLENCKFILDRNISRSLVYPGKYFFSRDARLKNLFEFNFTPENYAKMAKSIRSIPHLVIKGTDSSYIDESSNEVFFILKGNNPNFEFHEVQGRHHLHLNNPKEVGQVVNEFINRYRPSKLNLQQSELDEEQEKRPHPSKL